MDETNGSDTATVPGTTVAHVATVLIDTGMSVCSTRTTVFEAKISEIIVIKKREREQRAER